MKNRYSTKEETKEAVALRKKPMTNGGYSLYLDYTIGGVRTKEYLKMYIVPERNKIDVLQNVETLKTANAVKAQRTIDLQNGNMGFRNRAGEKILLTDYMDKRSRYYYNRGSKYYAQTVLNTKQYCISFRGDKTKLSQVKRDYLLGFVEHLNQSDLGDGTIYTYFTCLLIILNSAVRERLILENESKYIEASMKPKMKESTRAYLNLEEVKSLAAAPCDPEILKHAFLFSCFCGLRISDIRALEWRQVVRTNDGHLQVEMRTEKTDAVVYLPLSENAAHWLPERRKDGKVFEGLPTSPTLERRIDKWRKSAGIDKHITFHSARHTIATLLLEYGADIYTVSEILGHKNIKTTQVYAKIVDKAKREAVDNIPSLI